MSKKLTWAELAPSTRAKRFAPIAANHLPVPRTVHTMAAKHAKCQQGAACVGPGCRVGLGR